MRRGSSPSPGPAASRRCSTSVTEMALGRRRGGAGGGVGAAGAGGGGGRGAAWGGGAQRRVVPVACAQAAHVGRDVSRRDLADVGAAGGGQHLFVAGQVTPVGRQRVGGQPPLPPHV